MRNLRSGRALILAAALGLGAIGTAKAQPYLPYPPGPPVAVRVMPPRPVGWYYAPPAPRWAAVPRPYYGPAYGPRFVHGHWHMATGQWIPGHWVR